MATVRIAGDSSGFVDLRSPAAAGAVTVTLPSANGTMLAPAVVNVNGALLIGNTLSGGFDTAVIVQGVGTIITNDKGSITISSNTQGISYALLNGYAMP